MGFRGPTASVTAKQKYVQRISQPSYSSGTGAGSVTSYGFRKPGERDFYENPSLKAAGGVTPEAALNTVFTAPATIEDRPLAALGTSIDIGTWAADQVLHPGQNTSGPFDKRDGGPGPIEGFGEFVRDIPIAGDIAEKFVQAVGSTDIIPGEGEFKVGLAPARDFSKVAIHELQNGWEALLASRWAASLDLIKDMAPTDKIERGLLASDFSLIGGILTSFTSLGTGPDFHGDLPDWVQTAGDYRKWLNDDIHFTYDMQEAVINGDRGWLDLGTGTGVKATSDDIANAIVQMGLHPANFIGIGAAGAVASKMPTSLKLAAEAFRGTAHITKAPAVAARIAPRVINSGSHAGVTLDGFASWGVQAAQVAGKATRAYTKGAIGLTAVQLAVNEADKATPDQWRQDIPVLDMVYSVFRDMSDRRPLSDNQTFILASMFLMPGLGALRGKLGKTRETLRTGTIPKTKRPYPIFGKKNLANEQALVDLYTKDIAELKGKDFNARRQWVTDTYGQEFWDRHTYQIIRGADEHLLYQSGLKTDPYRHKNWFGSLSEMGAQIYRELPFVNTRLEHLLQTRKISPQIMTEAAEAFYYTGGHASGGAITKATGGLGRGALDGRRALEFAKAFDEFNLVLERSGLPKSIVPKLSMEFTTIEGIRSMIQQVKWYKKQGGLTRSQANEILMNEQAIFTADRGVDGALANYLRRDKGPVDPDRLIKELERVMEKGQKNGDVVPERELFASEEAWAAHAAEMQRDASSFQRRMASDGTLRNDVGGGPVEVRLPSASRKDLAQQVGDEAASVDAARARPDVYLRETEFPRILKENNINAESAVQFTILDGNVATPGMSIRFDGTVAPQTAWEVAAHGLSGAAKGVRKASVVTRGRTALADHRLTRNAAEFVWDLPARIAGSEYNELVAALRSRFGEGVTITDKQVSVIVRGDTAKPLVKKNLDTYLNSITRKTGADGYKMHPVHVQDIVRGKVNKTDAPGTITVKNVKRNALRGYTGGRRYYAIESGLANLEGRALPVTNLPGPAGVVGRYRTGQHGQYGQRGAGTASENGGSGAFRDPEGVLTPYEGGRFGHPRGRTEEYVVGADGLGEAQGRARTHFGDPEYQFPTGSTVRTIPGGAAGTVVSPTGELTIWRSRRPGRNITEEHGDLLAESSEHATWTRVDYSAPGAKRLLDDLRDHGWRPLGRTRGDSPVIYLLRDVAGDTGLAAMPAGKHGIKSIYDGLPVGNAQGLRANVEALIDAYFPNGAKVRIEAVESKALDLYARNTIDELEAMHAGVSADPAVSRALEMGRNNPSGAGYAVRPAGSDPFPLSARAQIEGGMTPEQVTFIRTAERDIGDVVPNMDISIMDNKAGLPPAEWEKIQRVARELQLLDPTYVLSVAPKGSTPWYSGQGLAYRQMVGGRQAFRSRFDMAMQPLSQFMNMWSNPVYTKTLSLQAKAETYNQFLDHGATVKQVNNFTNKVGRYYDSHTAGVFGSPLLEKRAGVRRYRRPDAIPEKDMERMAAEAFGPDVMNSIKAGGDNIMDMLQRSQSRFYRNLSKKFGSKDGEGNLLGLVEQYYGRGNQGTFMGEALKFNRRAQGTTKAIYHILRFLADPRWFALNWFEAEFLGISRAGLSAGRLGTRRFGIGKNVRETRLGKTGQQEFVNADKALDALSEDRQFIGRELDAAGDFNPSVRHDITQAGQMDPRSLGGHRYAVFSQENPQLVRQMLIDEFSMRPDVQALKRHYGGTFDGIVDEVIDQLGRFDEVGVRETYMDELAKMGLTGNEARVMREMVDTIAPQQQELFKDVAHTFHGNVNRNNLERLANNPLLWWPVSYQLKVYKNLADFMFNRMGGYQTNWGGTALLYTLMQGHQALMENDENYAAVWNDHPEFWQMAGMMLPVTPWEDIGVYMSRPGRFASNWVGAHMGVTERDPNYPDNPLNFIARSFALGPFFTSSLVNDIANEFGITLELPES